MNPGQAFIERTPQRIEIGARIEKLAVDLFGRRITERSRGPSGRLQHIARRRAKQRRNAEIHQYRPIAVYHKDILRLDIRMDDASRMKIVERFTQMLKEMTNPLQVEKGPLLLFAKNVRVSLDSACPRPW